MRTNVFLPWSAEAVFGRQTSLGVVFRALWQRDEFRSSSYELVGRQMSFGVVERLPVRPKALFQENLRPQKGNSPSILLFYQQISPPHRVERHSRPEIITPKLVSLPPGASGLLRNAICCQRGPRKTVEKSSDGPSRAGFLTPTREGPQRGATCSLSSPRGRPGELHAGGCPGPGPCGTRRCRCGP